MAHAFLPEHRFRVVGQTDDAPPGLIIDPPLPPTPDGGSYAGAFLQFGEERVTITGDRVNVHGSVDRLWLCGERQARMADGTPGVFPAQHCYYTRNEHDEETSGEADRKGRIND